jgi:hypothetical protein
MPVIKNSSRSGFAGTIGYGTGFVNSGAAVDGVLKVLEKPAMIVKVSLNSGPFVTGVTDLNRNTRFCALSEICC